MGLTQRRISVGFNLGYVCSVCSHEFGPYWTEMVQ